MASSEFSQYILSRDQLLVVKEALVALVTPGTQTTGPMTENCLWTEGRY